MGLFSKKVNKELFELLEADADDNKIGIDGNVTDDEKIHPSHAITVAEVLKRDDSENNETDTTSVSPIDSLKKRMYNMTHSEDETVEDEPQKKVEVKKADEEKKAQPPETLLQKCRPYIVDEKGRDATTPKEPLYRLQTVAEILENDSKRTIDALSKKYNITVDDLSENNNTLGKTVKTDTGVQSEAEVKVKNVQTSLPDISDIDNFVAPKDEEEQVEPESATIRFTPIKGESPQSNKIKVATTTNTLEFTNEIEDMLVPESVEEKTHLEETEFDSFSVDEEYRSYSDAKKLIYKLSVKKRNSFLRIFGSLITVLLLACFEIPTLHNLMLSNTKPMMSICTGIFALSVLINLDMFAALSKFFSRKSSADVTAALAAVATLLYSGFSIFYSTGDYELVLMGAVILFFPFNRSIYEPKRNAKQFKADCNSKQ